MILLDSGGLLALLNGGEPEHGATAAAFEREPPPYVLSPFVLAEVDYLLLGDLGTHAEVGFLRDVAAGAYDLAPFDSADVEAAIAVIEHYADLKIGLADASIVVLAGRYGTNRVLTLDLRHFRTLRTPSGEKFKILPADA